uniref:DM domain-containing protein n=1 Tax=Periophthalmus magnuspinnatus TaxID=409849 RepID=A0A3B4AER8_9GOBI
MSSSKKKAEGPPRSKCGRCRNHGVVVPQKGHAKKCPFTLCTCWKCQLITERTRINTLERELRRGSEDQCAGTGPSTPGHHIHPDTSPNTGAPQPDPAVKVWSRPISGAEPRAPGPALAERFDSGSPPAGSSARTAPENTPRGPTPTPAPSELVFIFTTKEFICGRPCILERLRPCAPAPAPPAPDALPVPALLKLPGEHALVPGAPGVV